MENSTQSEKADVSFKTDIIYLIRLFQVSDVSIEKTAEDIIEKVKEWEEDRKNRNT